MVRAKEPCPKCGTHSGYGWDMRLDRETVCDHAYHDKDRDPCRYGRPGEDE